MHATIRHYEGFDGTADEIAQALRQAGSRLRGAPDLVSLVVLDSESGVLTIVTVSEDAAAVDRVDDELEEVLRRLDLALPATAQVTAGEILYQRGL